MSCPKPSKKYRKALRDDLQLFRMANGSCCDFLAVGREHGAGMALTAMTLLKP